MLIVCPSCKIKFTFDDNKVGPEGIKLRCSKCRTIFRVIRKARLATPELFPPPVSAPEIPPVPSEQSNRITVVVANESRAFCSAVQKVLASEPFDVYTFNDGKSALAAIEQLTPDVVLLDVALPLMYGFEVCDAVRKNAELSEVKIILIASIYDKTRYKRSPISYYGADDYIEKHHIPDSLATMVYRLVAGQKPAEEVSRKNVPQEEAQSSLELPTPGEIAAQQAVREELRRDEELETSVPAPTAPELPESHKKARRLARIIVSDIVLYNQGKVEEGLRNGTFYDLLADDIREGRALYERRVAVEVRAETSFLEEAFEELIARKKSELG